MSYHLSAFAILILMKVIPLVVILARANTSKNHALSQGVPHWHLVSFRNFLDHNHSQISRFEAGFGINDMFRHLIVDPGDLKWEQTCPGALYVAFSRAKTMGTVNDDTSFPQDSAIYWYGTGISTTRILDGHLKNNTTKGGPKVKCLLITKRDSWVAFLHQRKEETSIKVFSDVEKRELRLSLIHI